MSGRPVEAARITPDEKSVLFLRAQPTLAVQTLFAFDVATGADEGAAHPRGAAQGRRGEALARGEGPPRAHARQRPAASPPTSSPRTASAILRAASPAGSTWSSAPAARSTELQDGRGRVIDPKFSPDGKQRRLRARPRRLRRRPGDQQGAPRHHGRHRGEDARPGRVRRPGGDGPLRRLLVVARTRSPSPTRSRTPRGWRSSPSSTRCTPSSGADDTSLPARRARPTPRCGWASSPSTGGKTIWVEWDAEKYPYLATRGVDEDGPLTRAGAEPRRRRRSSCSRSIRRPARRVSCSTEKDEAWVEPRARTLPAVAAEDGSGFLWSPSATAGPRWSCATRTASLARTWVKPDGGLPRAWRATSQTASTRSTSPAAPNPTESYLWRVKDGGDARAGASTGTDGPGVRDARSVSKDGQTCSSSTIERPRRMPRTYVVDARTARAWASCRRSRWSRRFTPNVELPQGRRRGLPGVADRARATSKPGQKLPGDRRRLRRAHVTVVHAAHGGAPDRRSGSPTRASSSCAFDNRGTPRRGRDWERAMQGRLRQRAARRPGRRAAGARRKKCPSWTSRASASTAGPSAATWRRWRCSSARTSSRRRSRAPRWSTGTTTTPTTPSATSACPEQHRRGLREELAAHLRAPKLERPLLLVHGTADDNVYFFHTLKLSDALFRAGKPYELLPLPRLTHMVPDPLVTERQYERVIDALPAPPRREVARGPRAKRKGPAPRGVPGLCFEAAT